MSAFSTSDAHVDDYDGELEILKEEVETAVKTTENRKSTERDA